MRLIYWSISRLISLAEGNLIVFCCGENPSWLWNVALDFFFRRFKVRRPEELSTSLVNHFNEKQPRCGNLGRAST